MKLVIKLLILLCLIQKTNAQSFRTLDLTLLKENYKIDSLFREVIHQSRSSNRYFSFTVLNSYFSGVSHYFFGVSQLKTGKRGIYFPFMQPIYMKNFGYFLYNGNVIFVSGGIDPYNFFRKTTKSHLFHFAWNKKNIYENNSGELFFSDYEYKNGQFVNYFPVLQ